MCKLYVITIKKKFFILLCLLKTQYNFFLGGGGGEILQRNDSGIKKFAFSSRKYFFTSYSNGVSYGTL